MEGDVAAARLLLERVIPPLRPACAVTLPDGPVTADGVLRAVASGDLSIADGAALLELEKSLGKQRNSERVLAKYGRRIPTMSESMADLLNGD